MCCFVFVVNNVVVWFFMVVFSLWLLRLVSSLCMSIRRCMCQYVSLSVFTYGCVVACRYFFMFVCVFVCVDLWRVLFVRVCVLIDFVRSVGRSLCIFVLYIVRVFVPSCIMYLSCCLSL